MQINSFIEKTAEKIKENASNCSSLANSLNHLKQISYNGSKIVNKVSSEEVSCKLAGVDSGFVPKKLAYLDLVLIKTAGVVFNYKKGVLEKAEYYPKTVVFPEPILLHNALEKDEEDQSVSLERLKKEVGVSIEIIEKFKPKFFFIDGSIVPQYKDKPRKESRVNEDYISIITLFQKFYTVAENNNCVLISCVEDSRGSRFIQFLRDEICKEKKFENKLNRIFDSTFLDYFLGFKERTLSFTYTKKILEHPILKDYSPSWAKNIFVFYLKCSELDKPLRIEFISKSNPEVLASKIASIVFSISSLHKEYSYPSVLIEADLRARLSPQEISIVFEKLVDKVGANLLLRRNSRPFG